MGRDATFYCRDCRTSYYLGYGSYTSWLDGCDTVRQFDEHAAVSSLNVGELGINQRLRECLATHAGHDHCTHSADWSHERGGKLYGEFGPMGADVELFSVEDWTHINLAKRDESPTPPPKVLGSTGSAALDQKLAAWEARRKHASPTRD